MELFSQFLKFFQRNINLFFCMGRHEGKADQCIVLVNGRSHHRVHENSLIKQHAGDGEGLEIIPDIQRNDGVTVLPMSNPSLRKLSIA